MNKMALDLLQDLKAAGMLDNPPFIKPVQGRNYVRMGKVAVTAETEKMEIAGMPCGVTKEENGDVRIFVFTERGATGPYRLKSEEVL